MAYKDPEKQRAYAREWMKRNPQKAREAMRRWRQRNPDLRRERNRLYKRAAQLRTSGANCRNGGAAFARTAEQPVQLRRIIACLLPEEARTSLTTSCPRAAVATEGN